MCMEKITLDKISEMALWNESECVEHLLPIANEFKDNHKKIFRRAKKYVEEIRSQSGGINIESFINEYSLDSREGVMIMCLAEALLRIPDKNTIDELIKDKLESPKWEQHIDSKQPLFINAATWSLMLTGKVINLEDTQDGISGAFAYLLNRMSEPVIRTAITKAMHFLGTQFVIGENIHNALKRAEALHDQGYLLSYDMLGEAAITNAQAEDFYQSYMDSITHIGEYTQHDKPLHTQAGISVKLSALHPRYELMKRERVISELLPRLKNILLHAKKNHIPVAIDAEESSRLDISLEILNNIIKDKELADYDGIGFVVQAYQKRASFVIKHIINLAKEHNHYIPIRLVKGAYWDSEIKWAQESGLEGYPVFTKKSHTDLSYFACANIMLDNIDYIYPQFATHNALTVAGILEISELKNIADTKFEFQRLYGMGETFYNQMVGKRSVRIYAPIGKYNELLPYLIRRLLENGANTSFVNMVVDEEEPLSKLLRDPINRAIDNQNRIHNEIPLPHHLFKNRQNSSGYDLGNKKHLEYLSSIVNDKNSFKEIAKRYDKYEERNTASAIEKAHDAFNKWNNTSLEVRCQITNKIADLIVDHRNEAISLLINEAGKTIEDAISEIREAEDFCRYYSNIADTSLSPQNLQSPTGESNILTFEGRGVFACISPWNFPMAIFTGQIVAALVSGNCVIAKPAAQTPRISQFIIKLMHDAGIDKDVLQLVIGSGRTIGEEIINNNNIAGVAFTGSTEIAQHINITLAKRNTSIARLVAETGGQNCMIVDSSALLEQACNDIITSAFGSAGQRCSALRILYVQEDIADQIIELIAGAMAELKVGNPKEFDTDIGPVIDQNAKEMLQDHIDIMHKNAKFIACAEVKTPEENFIAPHAFEIDKIDILKEEIFGPILHIIRYKSENLSEVINDINNIGYGLTCGIHSRIDKRINYIKQSIRAGNLYINRSITGAVVGVQPFGGMGLSGTGPKAGGENYLHAFTTEKTITTNTAAIGGNVDLYGGKYEQ